MQGQKLIFGYWGLRGRGQVGRYLLEYTGTTYEEKRYSDPKEWFGKDQQEQIKNGFLYPNLPYVCEGTFYLSESLAVEEYIIKRAQKEKELLGKDCKEEANVKMLIGVLSDFQNSILGLVYNPKYEECKQQEFDSNFKGYLQLFATAIGNKKFLHADTPRYSDFKLYENLQYIKGIYPQEFAQFNVLVAFLKNFEELPKIKEYMSSNRFIKVPFQPPGKAKWTGL